MRTIEIIKEEIEKEVTKEVKCDNCKDLIGNAGACGFGEAFCIHLNDAWCYSCGGKSWDFCSLRCLREFVNNNELVQPRSAEIKSKAKGREQ